MIPINVKERILEKADELFNRYGIRSVSMDDIATNLGISKKTVYQYYTDKEELVGAVMNRKLENNRRNCICANEEAENPIHEIFLAFDQVSKMFASMNPAILFDLEKYHPSVYQNFSRFKMEFLYGMLTNNLKKGVEQELYRPEINIDVMVRYRIESIMMPFRSEVFPTNTTELLQLQRELMEHFLYGIAGQKGRKLIAKYKQQREKAK